MNLNIDNITTIRMYFSSNIFFFFLFFLAKTLSLNLGNWMHFIGIQRRHIMNENEVLCRHKAGFDRDMKRITGHYDHKRDVYLQVRPLV